MLKRILMTTTLALVGFSAAATTAMTPAEQHAGKIFLTGNLGYGKVSETVDGLPKASGGFSTDFSVGYHANSVWGAEIGYNSYPNQKFAVGVTGNGNHAFFLAVRGTMDLHEHFKVYGRVGPAMVHHKLSGTSNDSDRSELTVFWGGGLSYALTDDLDLNVLDFHSTLKRNSVPTMYFVGMGVTWTPALW